MKMKKLLSMAMIFAVLMTSAACGNKVEDSIASDGGANIAEEPSGADEPSDAEEPREEEPSEEESDKESDKEDSKESSDVTTPGNGSVDLSNVATATDALEPAEVGQWIESTTYSATTHQYETIYWRVVEVTSDCQADIDRYNGEDHIYTFEPLENEDLAYRIVIYEVYFPEDYPAQEWGISSPELSLWPKNPNGGGITYKGVTYIGLGGSYEVAEDQEIFPGDVYTGKALYVMIDDDVDYVFEYSHNNNSDMVYDYAASK